MTTQDHPHTLQTFIESVETCIPLYQFYKQLLQHEHTYTTGDLPEQISLSFEYHSVDITHLMLDAVAFGIYQHQEHSSTHYFDTPNALTSTTDVIHAQPHADVALFFWYKTCHRNFLVPLEVTEVIDKEDYFTFREPQSMNST